MGIRHSENKLKTPRNLLTTYVLTVWLKVILEFLGFFPLKNSASLRQGLGLKIKRETIRKKAKNLKTLD